MAKSLQDWQTEILEINQANGWFDKKRSFGDDVALLHTEVSEMYEAYREWLFADATGEPDYDEVQSIADGTVEVIETRPAKPEGVGSELADVLVRVLDTAERYGIDIEFEMRRKLAYNRTRGYRHGGKHA